LDLREVRPVNRRIQASAGRIARHAEPRAAQVNQAKALGVEDVEDIPTELEFVFLAPRHIERLREPHVHIRISGQANIIPRAGFPRIGIPEALVNGFNVAATPAEKLWGPGPNRPGSSDASRARVDRSRRCY